MTKWFLLLTPLFFHPCSAYPATHRPEVLRPPLIRSPLRTRQTQYEIKASIEQKQVLNAVDSGPYFDLPVTYNSKVKSWIIYFQTNGRQSFKKWLERSHRYLPKFQPTLEHRGLPKDLIYLAMIESGFSPRAVSSAAAVGYWQFIKPTATRYGLTVNWWLDERRDFTKSTLAAATYLNDLYKMFRSWYLAASAYNMGENRMKRLIKKHNTKNYWVLSEKKDFPKETREYIPKLIASMLISKQPSMYGFKDLTPMKPYNYTYVEVPGGTDLENMAHYIGADKKHLARLNSELVKGFVPQFVKTHRIRVPASYLEKASQFVRASL